MMDMQDDALLRYSRQIMLPQVGYEGQARLLESHALVIGLGGLGSPIALYLAAAGVGELTLADFDAVELSNLQRQIAHTTESLGTNKALSAKRACLALNPHIQINTVTEKLANKQLLELIAKADIVLDASDNYTTRFAINDICIQQEKPLISGAAIRMEAQISVFKGYLPDKPCYRCLYTPEGQDNETCSETGVLAPIVGVTGSIQAVEAIKVLLGLGEDLSGQLLLFDALTMDWRKLKLPKDPACPACKQD